MNILLVDDQPSVLSSLKSGLNWSALLVHNVYTALNASEAREIILSHPIDILLTDIEMPKESGLSLLRWCRENHYQFECIFLTSHADFFYAQEAIQLESFDYILQPARYEDIEQIYGQPHCWAVVCGYGRELAAAGAAVFLLPIFWR